MPKCPFKEFAFAVVWCDKKKSLKMLTLFSPKNGTIKDISAVLPLLKLCAICAGSTASGDGLLSCDLLLSDL